MNRVIITTAVLSLSRPAYACFDGSAYGYNFSDGLLFLFYSLIGFILVVALRVLRNNFRLYFPIVVAAASLVLPAWDLWWWGNGDCGYSFVKSSQLCAGAISLLLIYEVIRLYRYRRTKLRNGDA